MKNLHHKLILSAVFFLFLFSLSDGTAAGLYDPSLKWRTLSTEHFLIHYHQGEENQARLLAAISEETFEKLHASQHWTPKAKTEVVIADITDSANGSATPYPVNSIVLYLSEPEPLTALDNYTCSLRYIFTHEYTHILNLDIVNGFCTWTRTFPGRVWFPSLFQPLWILEGNAVLEESRLEGMGRNTGAYGRMVIRTEVLSGKFSDISHACVFPRDWPGGNVPYLYGGLFLEYLEQKYGKGKAADIFLENSDNILPYLNYKNGQDVFGKDFTELWNEWKTYTQKKIQQQYITLQEEGLTEYRIISDPESDSTCPAFSPDGKTVYCSESSPREGTCLVSIDTETGSSQKLCRLFNPGRIAVSSSGKIFISDSEVYRNFSIYTEIYCFDKKYRPLTEGRRSKYVAVSSDGTELVYVRQNRKKYFLTSDSMSCTEPETVLESDFQLAWPALSPDGRKIAFSARSGHGGHFLYILDRNSMELTCLTDGKFHESMPAWTPDGLKLIFSSDRSGIYNLWEYDLSAGTVTRLTNVAGGAFQPTVSPDGKQILFSSYEKNGRAAALMLMPEKPFSEPVPTKAEKKDLFCLTAQKEEDSGLKQESSAYSPLPSVLPQYFLPLFYSQEIYKNTYDYAAGVCVTGYDILRRHSYYAYAACFPVHQKRMAINALYTNSVLYPDISLHYQDELLFLQNDRFPYRDRNTSAASRELSRLAGLNVSLPFRHIASAGILSFAGIYEKRKINFFRPPYETEKNIILSSGRISCAFSSAETHAYSVVPEKGRYIFFSGDLYSRHLQSDFSFFKAAGKWTEYFPGFGTNHGFSLQGRTAAFIRRPGIIKPFSLGKYSVTGTDAEIRDVWGLRGFDGGCEYGSTLSALTAEYSLPFFQKDTGTGMLPVMLRDLWLKFFLDAGDVWNSRKDIKFHAGTGAELHFNLTAGYSTALSGFWGIAQGIGEHAETKTYFGLASDLSDYMMTQETEEPVIHK